MQHSRAPVICTGMAPPPPCSLQGTGYLRNWCSGIYRAYTKEWCGFKRIHFWYRTILLCMPCIVRNFCVSRGSALLKVVDVWLLIPTHIAFSLPLWHTRVSLLCPLFTQWYTLLKNVGVVKPRHCFLWECYKTKASFVMISLGGTIRRWERKIKKNFRVSSYDWTANCT
jgi:hypothetical protein